ncbi:voltage-dependent calcium channel subunit alpha-2/delta-3-like isoform X2 [Paramacrobiotus metropolitanus]|uniref:voltage-dependent calcium channel subunit alpha-2/delta-3-like isoform X2 n=1 Tax=Paramacrobiotus metropolitanus TaxID=2943436 RepID=UPI002445F29C|nr:voltage-dependent calcium channel subunit alpha-2/delta-3-like isoform X2 [Paramacrobiotus metropolitanus]
MYLNISDQMPKAILFISIGSFLISTSFKRLGDFAEEIADGYRWDGGINTSYPNAKEPDSHTFGFDPVELIQDSRFHNDAVNLQSSTLHVPTNVFSRSLAIQNAAKWTKKLNHMFRYNFYHDHTLVSQYFASTTGFQRMYPGVRWQYSRDPDKPDMYDCRLTNWYIRAASSPKDLVILLDISGSMTGRRRDTARRTAIEIMNTLTDDDFFNILTFKDDTHFLDPCNNGTLVQATDAMKKRFEKLLFTLPTKNFANYTVALPVAFDLLQRNDTEKSAKCNKAIMIVSDNAPDSFEDICSRYNPERNVRFFAYVIGREVTQYDEMVDLACNNRGYVGHIITMADVRDLVQEYYRIMGRPMVLMNNHSQIWTNAYWHPRNVLGVVVSTAQPIFNRSAIAGHKGDLLGVAGIDVPIEDFVKSLTPHKWGVGSYIFGINHNGKVLFHPSWKLYLTPEGYRSPRKPEIDLALVEFEVNKTTIPTSYDMKLRNDMINQITGNIQMQVLRSLQDGKRVFERDYQYYYTSLPQTPFSVAIAIPIGMGRPYSAKLRIGGKFPAINIAGFLQNTEWTVHPKWPYCKLSSIKKPTDTVTLLDNKAHEQYAVDNSENSTQTCDVELTESLAFDAKATFAAGNHWFADIKEHSDLYGLYGITTCFTVTRAGLTRWKDLRRPVIKFNSTDSTNSAYDLAYLDDLPSNSTDNTTSKHFFHIFTKAVDEAFYERTIASAADVTISPMIVPSSDENNNVKVSRDVFMASLPVFIGDESRKQAPAAVTGIMMRISGLRNLLLQLSKNTCNGSSSCLSCHSPSIVCYLLDENGYVIMDNRYPENSGKFFGALEGEVMDALVQWEVYKRVTIRDYQDMCKPNKTEKNAGCISKPWINVHKMLQGLLILAELLYGQLLFLLSLCKSVLTAEDYYIYETYGNDTVEHVPEPPRFPCETDTTLFTSTWNELKLSFQINCLSTCVKNVEVYKVSLTNLILVALDGQRSCPCDGTRMSAEPRQVKYSAAEECRIFNAFPYRKRPADCAPYFQSEDYSECGRPWVPYSTSDRGILVVPDKSALLLFLSFNILVYSVQ